MSVSHQRMNECVCSDEEPDKPEVKAINLQLYIYDRNTITHTRICVDGGVFIHGIALFDERRL